MAKPGPALLGLAAGAFLLMTRKKAEETEEHPAWKSCPGHQPEPGDESAPVAGDLMALCESPRGRPLLGKMYQSIKSDNHLTVARKALFGSSEGRVDPKERQAVIDLSIRIDCSPWNQMVNGRGKDQLAEGHYAAEQGLTDKGIVYLPTFPDNRSRLMAGEAPLVGEGHSYPYIWIPMIDLDKFMLTGEVTTAGQDYPDTEEGRGYNMIMPPPWILDLGFEGELSPGTVGCELPEGDFRQDIDIDEES